MNYMYEELKERFENEIITEAEFYEIDFYLNITKNGYSGLHIGLMWYTASDERGNEFDFYFG